ncbi:MAG TPA: hypothetical protein PLE99_09845 [Candidatus Thiothrix moscowensis]|uniref:hypothetical protein n=1 Tax=Thiothrix sp. UBA2016 TaxID=1947695 RepID=UPI0025DE0979|nr:hypothetical protein [Thiothrix sp. UBA2016]HRJ53061.1 hypothetical protein [Candidatus Thiothrix moscowensis]HRJ93052.1 hypothetical protein [Candidatus Thiothrix moscowensis]
MEEGNAPNPTAMFAGRVLENRELASSLDDSPFYWLWVRTYNGEYDVVVSADIVDGVLATDSIVSGVFWLCGRMSG